MEKLPRLRRNTQKDYSQVVEFPVEIVGRDGQVRRFSFDASVRLYQRRVLSAPLRYEETEDIEAELFHCRQRIEQLRRSYLEHSGFDALRGEMRGAVFGTPLAAEGVSLLCRAFQEDPEGPPSISVTALEVGTVDIAFVRSAGRSFLLYAWRIDGAGPTGAREAWQESLSRLSTAPEGQDVERLLLQWSCPDVALILTGTQPAPDLPTLEEPPLPTSGEPWLDGMRAIYEGQLGLALQRLERGLEQNPSRRVLAEASALVALLDGQLERAIFNARSGLLYHPHDSLLLYAHAVAETCMGNIKEAEAQNVAALKEAPSQPLLLLDALLKMRRGAFVTGLASLRRIPEVQPDFRFVSRGAQRLRWRMMGAGLIAVAGLCCALMAIQGPPIWWLLSLQCLVIAPLWVMVKLRAVLASPRYSWLPLLSPELLPREKKHEAQH